MAGGLAALLDDVAMIAKLASAASTKAMGVVIDDAAVTPRYVTGLQPARELPIIWRIAKGSLRNKAIILALALTLSQFAPWLLTPILMLGGTYLCFEGAEKVWETISGHHEEQVRTPGEPQDEKTLVAGAVTTDFILSAEIMVISLNELAAQSFWMRAAALTVVGLLITVLVYGVVGFIVKLDDIGLRMMAGGSKGRMRLGQALVDAMPKVLAILSTVGIAAMLWVGGHIILDGAHKLGWHAPLDLAHGLAHLAAGIPAVGGAVEWLIETVLSALLGLLLGGLIVAVAHLILHKKKVEEPAH